MSIGHSTVRVLVIPFFIFLVSSVSVFSQNCTVNAGIFREWCDSDSIRLFGLVSGLPKPGTLVWQQISGPSVIIQNPSSLTPFIIGATGGNMYSFRLFSECQDGSLIFDDVTYSVRSSPVTNAGMDISSQCPGMGNLNASPLGVNEQGIWTVVGQTGVVNIINPNNPLSSVVFNTNGGNTTLRWTVTNIVSGCQSFDDVMVVNCGGATPVDAGSNVVLSNCYSSTTSTVLNGSNPGVLCGQSGTWSLVSGPNVPNIAAPNSPNSAVSNLIAGTYVFRWLVNGPCASGVDEVTITVPAPVGNGSIANISNPVQVFCDNRTETVLQANVPDFQGEVVQWTQVGGPMVSILSPNSPVTLISGLVPGSGPYVFEYTITNPITGCTNTATATLSYSDPVSITALQALINLPCAQVTATLNFVESGQGITEWRLISAPSGVNAPTAFSPVGSSPLVLPIFTVSGTYIIELVRRSPSGVFCDVASTQVTVVASRLSTPANAGTDQLLGCNINQTALAGNNPLAGGGVGIGTWTQVSGPNVAVISDINAFNSPLLNLIPGTYTFRWVISGGPFCSPNQDEVIVRVANAIPVLADAGTDQTVCSSSPIFLNANQLILNEVGTWSISPDQGDVFDNPNKFNATVPGGLAPGVYTFTWTVVNACGSISDNITVTVDGNVGPQIADAGADICELSNVTSVMLNANTLNLNETGLWTQVGTLPTIANIVNPNSNTTEVNNLVSGTYTFVWSITTPNACVPSTDTIQVTLSSPIPKISAGPDQFLCLPAPPNIAQAVFSADAPPSGNIGTWSQIFGPAGFTITDINDPQSNISGLISGVYSFEWIVSNGVCILSRDTVNLYISIQQEPANAGLDQSICFVNSANLNANPVQLGIWSVVSGPNVPVFADIYDPQSTISNLLMGSYVLQWNSYSSGPYCPPSVDQVVITVVPQAIAGDDQSFCLSTNNVNLFGNLESTGSWTLVSQPMGASTILSTTSNNTASASNMNLPGIYTFRYTIDVGGACESFDDISFSLFDVPNEANAGPNQLLCNEFMVNLAANLPGPGFIGAWSQSEGPSGVTFSPDVNGPMATANLPGPGIYTFIWSISNGGCISNDEVRIEVADNTPADAGVDLMAVCTNQVNLNASAPTNAVGTWTFISGPIGATPIIQNPNLNNTLITSLTVSGDYIFEWTVNTTGGICPSTSDDVMVTIEDPATVASAGPDQLLCDVTEFSLNANMPNITETGVWSFVSGPNMPNIIDINDPNTLVNSIVFGEYLFAWTITNGNCISSDTVSIWNLENPVADAGMDQVLCLFQNLTLVGNTPTAPATGQWTQISGPPVNILTPNNPTSFITGVVDMGENYIFRWTINNGACPSSSDDVMIQTLEPPAIAQILGGDRLICGATSPSLVITTTGINPTDIGAWSQISGPGVLSFSPDNDIFTLVSGFNIPAPNTFDEYIIRWSVTNSMGECEVFDEISIFVYGDPSPATVNTMDESFCDVSQFTVSAVPPTLPSFGFWLRVSGPAAGMFNNPVSPNTTFLNPAYGTYNLMWSTFNGPCRLSDNVILTNFRPIQGGQNNITICTGGEPVLSANAMHGSGNYTYQWQMSDGNCAGIWMDIPGANQSTYVVPSSITNSIGVYHFRVIINDDGPCDEFITDCISVTIVADPIVTVQPIDTSVCRGGQATMTFLSTGGTPSRTYQWQYFNGMDWVNVSNNVPTGFSYLNQTTESINITTLNDLTTSIGSFQYRARVSAAGIGCDDAFTVPVAFDVYADPEIIVQPVGTELCSGETHTMNIVAVGNIPSGSLNYLWQFRSTPGMGPWLTAPGLNNTASYTTVPITSPTEYRVQVIQQPFPRAGCETFSDPVEVIPNPYPIITSPSSAIICSGQTLNYLPTSNVPGTTFQWTAQVVVGTVDGFSPVGFGNISDVLTNIGPADGAVLYTITPTGPGISACEGLPFLLYVDVLNCVSEIGLSKQLSALTVHSDGTATAVYNYVLKNYGNTVISNVTLEDNLDVTFGPGNYEVLSSVSGPFIVDINYNGSPPNTQLLLPTNNTLAVNQSGLVTMVVRILSPGNYFNQAIVRGETPSGLIEDNSQNGPDPNPSNSGMPGDDDDPTPSGYSVNPLLGVSKNLAGLINNGDGSWNVSYEFIVRNYGNVDLNSIRVLDTLTLTFPAPCEVDVVSLSSSNFSIDPSFDGINNFNLLLEGPSQNTTNTLDVGEEKNIFLTLRVEQCDNPGPFLNQVTGFGRDPFGDSLEDRSVNGTDPDPDGDSNPNNNASPTPVQFIESPYLGLSKRIINTPINNGDGSYTFTFEFRLLNRGNVVINNLTLTDDLEEVFGGDCSILINSITSEKFAVNTLYNGLSLGDINLLAPGNSLATNDVGAVLLTVTAFDCSALGPWDNFATASGLTPQGDPISDLSQNGSEPDPAGTGDPQTQNDPTPFNFSESPLIAAAKQVVTVSNNGNGTHDVVFNIRIANQGNVVLSNIQATDNLESAFGAGNFEVLGITSTRFTVNVGYNGGADVNLLALNNSLNAGEIGSVFLTVRVLSGGLYENQANVRASSPIGTITEDDSNNGSNPDPNQDIPTPVELEECVLQISCPTGTGPMGLFEFVNSTADCGYLVQDISLNPTVISDNCDIVSVRHDLTVCCRNTLEGRLIPIGNNTITWTAVNAAGESVSCMIEINVVDAEHPVFVNCPNTTFIIGADADCENGVIWSIPVAEDNCEVTVSQTGGPALGSQLTPGVYNIQYTATDGNNNTATCNFTIEVVDDSTPLLVCQPDLTVGTDAGVCSWTSSTDELNPLLAVDNCPDYVLTHSINGGAAVVGVVPSGTVFALGTSVITYTLADSINTVSCSFSVTVVDDESPVISSLFCGTTTNLNTQPGQCTNTQTRNLGLFVTDNCTSTLNMSYELSILNTNGNLTVYNTRVITHAFELGVNIATLVVTDESGNTSSCSAVFVVNDNQAPVITCPAVASSYNNTTGECGYVAAGTEFDPTFSDNCPGVEISHNYGPWSIQNSLDGATFPVGTTVVVWTATDGSGNTSTCAITINVVDAEHPVFVNCPNTTFIIGADADCENGVIWSIPVAEDNCEVTVSQTGGPALGSQLTPGVYNIQYTATDGNNNTATCNFTIEVVDDSTPLLVCQPDLTVGTDAGVCSWTSSTDELNPLLAVDNCPDYVLTHSINGGAAVVGVVPSGTVFALGTSVITYTLADSINTVSCSFSVTVVDDESPVLIGCSAGGLFGLGNQTFSNDPGFCSVTLPGLFDATDNCELAPIAYIVFQRPNGSFFETTMNLIPGAYSLAPTTFEVGQWNYTITVYDLAGNSSQCLGQFQVLDTELPVIECPVIEASYPNTQGLCGFISGGGEFNPVFSDNCEGAVISHNYGPWSIPNSLDGATFPVGTTVVVWTVTDASGNTTTCEITINVVDTEIPVFVNCPTDVTFTVGLFTNDCEGGAIWSIPVAVDNCEINEVRQTEGPAQGTVLEVGIYQISYVAEDIYGNVSDTCTFFINVIDSEEPVIVCPANIVVNSTDFGICEWTSPVGSLRPLLITSNCPATVTWEVENPDGSIANGLNDVSGYTFTYGLSIVTYTITENASGQTWTCSFTVSVTDDEAPVVVCPSDLILECGDPDNEELISAWINSIQITDNCDLEPEFTAVVFSVDTRCGNTQSILYRFIATDFSGNSTECFANVVIQDTTPPMITNEAQDITVQCDGTNNAVEILNWLNNNGFATATDLCGNVTWSNDYGLLQTDCGLTGGVVVTFTATDVCGNVSMTTAMFTIIDTIAPVWEILPQDLFIECNGTDDPYLQINAWLNTVGGAEAEDDCSFLVYSHNFEGLSDGCSAYTGSAVVIFTATDACGNFVTASATVSIVDNTAPVIVVMARDTTVECDGSGNIADLQAWLANNAGAEAFDPCSDTLVWGYQLVSEVLGCGDTRTLRYAFTATDECGNVSVFTEALFNIIDTTSPEFDVLPQDFVVQCDGNGNASELNTWLSNDAGLVGIDICGAIVNVEFDLVSKLDRCGLTSSSLYRFTIVDACGNTSTAEANFIIVDTIPPAITGGADMNMEECTSPPAGNYPEFDFWLTNNAGATATESCGSFQWSNNYNPSRWIQLCGNTRYVDVTFYATDICGNVDSITHRFSIGDITPPVFTNCPRPPVIVGAPEGWCSAFVNFSQVAATDNCSSVVINQIDTTGLSTGSLFPVGLTVLSFEAIDECGNRSTCDIKVVVNDFHTPPTIACPQDITVDNDPLMCGAEVSNISPFNITDNCIHNVAVTYTILSMPNGVVTADGILDASGTKFEVGSHQVIYTVQDQPILLITEVVNDGVVSGVEISNFGPADYDITCLEIHREGPDNESHIVPMGTILQPGQVYTHEFSVIPAGTPVAYRIGFLDRIIDGVALQAYSPSFSWSGDLNGNHFIRNRILDTNTADDYQIVNQCDEGSFGFFNPELSDYIFPANGIRTSLQSRAPSVVSCAVNITVRDTEAPYCGEFEVYEYDGDGTQINEEFCGVSQIFVSNNFMVADVNVLGLVGDFSNMGVLKARLTSPSGTQVTLIDRQCMGTQGFDVSFDDEATQNLTTVACGPLGGGQTYQPLEALKAFFGENAFGTWTLEFIVEGNGSGQLEAWSLQLSELLPYSQEDVVLNNDTGMCGANFTWTHPVVADNCCVGTISVAYLREDNIIVSGGGILPGQGGQMITKYFPVGTTTVRYTIFDQSGNVATCSFDITVRDSENPVIVSCPSNVTIQLTGGQCTTKYAYPNPGMTDNCGVISVTFDPPAGFDFPIGVTTVTAIVSDAAGNTASCTFSVTVLEFIPTGGSLACNNSINLSLGPDCIAFLTPDMILEGNNYRCYDNYCVIIRNSAGQIIGSSENGTNFFTLDHVGQSFQVSICQDCNLGATNCCWSTVTVENKLIPDVKCPENVTIECNEVADPSFTGSPELLTCSPNATITYFDNYLENSQCSDPRAVINRNWVITTMGGDVVTCLQNIVVRPFNFENIVWPSDLVFENSLDCEEVANNPLLTRPDNTGWPTINGTPLLGHHLCEFNFGFTDEILQDANCNGAFEILRHWTIRNECRPLQVGVNPLRHIQAIKVNDKKGPVFSSCPVDVTVSTSPHQCRGTYVLGDLYSLVDDNCGDVKEVEVLINNGSVTQMPANSGNYVITNIRKGTHQVRLRARDHCKNSTVCTFNITVVDNTPPIAVAKQNIVISLTTTGVGQGGFAKLFAHQVDNGSHDNCGPVHLELRRENGAPSCNNVGTSGHNNNTTFSNVSHPSASDNSVNDTDKGEFVEFCCEDLFAEDVDVDGDGIADRGYVKVILRVWDDADMDGVFGSDGDNFNEVWAFVKVEEKLAPIISCPADIDIVCDSRIDQSIDFGTGFVNVNSANFDITGLPTVFSTCEGTVVLEFQDQFTAIPAGNNCGLGRITRTFRASSSGRVVFCTQIINISASSTQQPWIITPPPAGIVGGMACTGPTSQQLRANGPTWTGGPCDLIGENIKIDSFLFEGGVCKKWLVTYNYLNWCTGEQRGPFYRVFAFEDTVKPEFTNCRDTMYAAEVACELTQLRLHKTAVDAGGCTDQGWLKWQVLVDLDSDGTIDYEFSSYVPVGTDRTIIVDGVQRRQIYVAPSLNGSPIRGQGNQIGLLIPEAIGVSNKSHKVTWKVSDGCHNENVCIETFMVTDKKAPTPYCLNVSTALMQNGTLELWARDFDLGSTDNCTAKEDLMFTFFNWKPQLEDTIISGQLINRSIAQYFNANGFVTRYPTTNQTVIQEYNAGNMQLWLPQFNSAARMFSCEDLAGVTGSTIEVAMTVYDESGNSDFCVVNLILMDNNGACGHSSMIAGLVYTEDGDMMKDVTVYLDANLPEHPRQTLTDVNGEYVFNYIAQGVDYTVDAYKNDNHVNGVSTFDLVVIQRHILGIQEIESPYKLIAADATNDKRITVSDLIEIRKLILGSINEYGNNTSWRFVDAEYEFGNPQQPWGFAEQRALHDVMKDSMMNNDFIAVKVGDVNNSAQTGFSSGNTEVRSARSLEFITEDISMAKGQRIEVPVRASNFDEVSGFQFTMTTAGLQLIDVESAALKLSSNNFATPLPGVITMSWNSDKGESYEDDEILFVLVFQSEAKAQLSNQIGLTSTITRREAYMGDDMAEVGVKLIFAKVADPAQITYHLAQNEPNPFKEETLIRYRMAESGKATFTISDITGRVIAVREVDGVKGENSLVLRKSELPGATGILYYQMEAGEFIGVKNMIMID